MRYHHIRQDSREVQRVWERVTDYSILLFYY